METNNTLSKNFEFFDVTADIGVLAYGKTLEHAFENAAHALFDIITDTSKIKPVILKEFEIISEDKKALLYDWLSELIFLHDAEYLIFSEFKVSITHQNDEYKLNALIKGEEFDSSHHESRDEVKAITYHLMDIKKKKGYTLQFIVDV